MTDNPYFDIIEDTVVESLEMSQRLPQEFVVTLPVVEYRSFIAAGLYGADGEPIHRNRLQVAVRCLDRLVTVRSELWTDSNQDMLS